MMGIVKRTFSRRKPEIDIEKFKRLTAPPPYGMEIIQDAIEERRRLAKKEAEEWREKLNKPSMGIIPFNRNSDPKRCDGCGAPQQINKCKYCGSII